MRSGTIGTPRPCSCALPSSARQRSSHVAAERSHAGIAPPAVAVPAARPDVRESCVTDEQRQELERVYSQTGASSSADAEAATPAVAWSQLLQSARGLPSGSLDWWAQPLQVQVSGGPEPPKKKQRPEKHEDYYANVGDAIRTLRDDMPHLFSRDLNYDIYREDIVFKDPRNTFHGMKNYRLIFWSLRFHGNLFFKQLYVEVKRIWQKDDKTICLRWTVRGIPRLPWNPEGIFDGVSTYKLDSHGKIYTHKVDNTIMSDPPLARMPYLASLSPIRTPTAQQPFPTPFTSDPSLSDDCMHTPPGAA